MDDILILEIGGVLWIAFWLVGIFSLWMGTRSARGNFREKGYIRPPSGKAWFPFLLEKRYESFDNESIRFFFGISHFCLVAMFVIMAAVLVLVGIETLFRNIGGP